MGKINWESKIKYIVFSVAGLLTLYAIFYADNSMSQKHFWTLLTLVILVLLMFRYSIDWNASKNPRERLKNDIGMISDSIGKRSHDCNSINNEEKNVNPAESKINDTGKSKN